MCEISLLNEISPQLHKEINVQVNLPVSFFSDDLYLVQYFTGKNCYLRF